jgi:hypothetical protein
MVRTELASPGRCLMGGRFGRWKEKPIMVFFLYELGRLGIIVHVVVIIIVLFRCDGLAERGRHSVGKILSPTRSGSTATVA